MRPESLKALGAVPVTLKVDDAGMIEEIRQTIPAVVGSMTQIVVDNPGTFVLLASGTLVAARLAFNLVKPRTAVQALALAVVLQAGLPAVAMQAVKRGWLPVRVRDADGCLVPLERPQPDA